jgi:long-chain acyl-CoA synthetase
VVNVNPLYTPPELIHQLNDSGARVLVVLENFAHVVAEAWPDLALDAVLVASPGDLMGLKGLVVNLVSRHLKRAVPAWSLPGAVRFAAALAEGRGRKPAAVAVAAQDVAFLQYTGGTTGIAKGATLTHRNVAANVEQCRLWFSSAMDAARIGGGTSGGTVGNGTATEAVMVTALPLYHIFALTCCCLYIVRIGGCGLLIANPRDIPSFVKTLASRRFTMMSGVNTLYNALASHPDIGSVDFSQLVVAVAGGMATQAAVARRWKAASGRPIIEGYGLSETSPVVTINLPGIAEFSGTVGYPVPSTEVVVRSPEGIDLPEGQAGELCVRGPQVMAGYWRRPDETAKVMTADGFFRTGDIGVMRPDGQVMIVDRMKDMILVSGFNVYPNEVEDVLVTHPKVLEAAVIGVPDEHAGEAVMAYVVRREKDVSEAELRDFARHSLTGYKVPKHVVFRDTLPKSNVGKVLRRELRDEVLGKVPVGGPPGAAPLAEA